MVLVLATVLLCGFMIAIYRILRSEERQLAARQKEQVQTAWPPNNSIENPSAPRQPRAS